jgi:hypothetical protein
VLSWWALNSFPTLKIQPFPPYFTEIKCDIGLTMLLLALSGEHTHMASNCKVPYTCFAHRKQGAALEDFDGSFPLLSIVVRGN